MAKAVNDDTLATLLNKLHKALGSDASAQEKYGMHVMLADYLLDASRPRDAEKSEIITHIKERTAPSFSYGVNRRARALGLNYNSAKGKVVLKNNQNDAAYISNDAENSGLLLLDVALARVLERRTGNPVGSTYHLFARVTGMNAKRYYPDTELHQHAEYMRRCEMLQKPQVELEAKVEDIFDNKGNVMASKFGNNVVIIMENLTPTMFDKLFKVCEEKKACLRFRTYRPGEGRDMLEKYPEVMPHSLLSGEPVYQYTPLQAHPAYPLVCGPENNNALYKVENMLEGWIERGLLTENHRLLDPMVEIDSKPIIKERTPVLAEVIEQEAPTTAAPPIEIKKIFTGALGQQFNKMRSFLERHGISANNGSIFSIENSNHLPTVVTTMCKAAVDSMMNPTAMEVLIRVHWALSAKSLYVSDLHRRLPKDPWRAAIFLVIRQPDRYGVRELVYHAASDQWCHPGSAEAASVRQEQAVAAGNKWVKQQKPDDWSDEVDRQEKQERQEQRRGFFLNKKTRASPPNANTTPRGRGGKAYAPPHVAGISTNFEQEHYYGLKFNNPPPLPVIRGRGQNSTRGRGFSMRARGGMPRVGNREPVNLDALAEKVCKNVVEMLQDKLPSTPKNENM